MISNRWNPFYDIDFVEHINYFLVNFNNLIGAKIEGIRDITENSEIDETVNDYLKKVQIMMDYESLI